MRLLPGIAALSLLLLSATQHPSPHSEHGSNAHPGDERVLAQPKLVVLLENGEVADVISRLFMRQIRELNFPLGVSLRSTHCDYLQTAKADAEGLAGGREFVLMGFGGVGGCVDAFLRRHSDFPRALVLPNFAFSPFPCVDHEGKDEHVSFHVCSEEVSCAHNGSVCLPEAVEFDQEGLLSAVEQALLSHDAASETTKNFQTFLSLRARRRELVPRYSEHDCFDSHHISRPFRHCVFQRVTCCNPDGSFILHSLTPTDPIHLGWVHFDHFQEIAVDLTPDASPYLTASCDVHIPRALLYGHWNDHSFGHFVQETIIPVYYILKWYSFEYAGMDVLLKDFLLLRHVNVNSPHSYSILLGQMTNRSLDLSVHTLHGSGLRICIDTLITGLDYFATVDAPFEPDDPRQQIFSEWRLFTLNNFGLYPDHDPPTLPNAQTLVIRRPDKRMLLNDEEVVEHLVSQGFTTTLIDFGWFSVKQTARLLASVRIMIGNNGSGITNAIWMPRNSVVIILLPWMPAVVTERFCQQRYFEYLSALVGMHVIVWQETDRSRAIPEDDETLALDIDHAIWFTHMEVNLDDIDHLYQKALSLVDTEVDVTERITTNVPYLSTV